MPLSNRIILGRFGQSYGIKGWIKVQSYTDPADNILQYPQWQIQHQDQWQTVTIAGSELRGQHIIVKLPSCDTPETAQHYTNDLIAIDRTELPSLSDDEYYWSDLIGLDVVNLDHICLGQLDHFLNTPAHDVMVITGKKRRLLPYTDAVIHTVDLQKKQIIVDWDENF